MKRKAFVIAMILLAIFNISALSTLTYHRWLKPDRPPEGKPDFRAFKRLGFDDEQMERMSESRRAFFERTEPMGSDMNRLRGEMFKELSNDNPDTSVIFKLGDSISSLQNSIQREVIHSILSDGSVLTPEQRRRLIDMLERHMGDRWQDHRRMGRMFRGFQGKPPFEGPPSEMGEGRRPMDSSRRPGWRRDFRAEDSLMDSIRRNNTDMNEKSSTTGRR